MKPVAPKLVKKQHRRNKFADRKPTRNTQPIPRLDEPNVNAYEKNYDRRSWRSKRRSDGSHERSERRRNVSVKRLSSNVRKRETNVVGSESRSVKNVNGSETLNERNDTRNANSATVSEIGIGKENQEIVTETATATGIVRGTATEIAIVETEIDKETTVARRRKLSRQSLRRSCQRKSTSAWSKRLWLIFSGKALKRLKNNQNWRSIRHWHHHRESLDRFLLSTLSGVNILELRRAASLVTLGSKQIVVAQVHLRMQGAQTQGTKESQAAVPPEL